MRQIIKYNNKGILYRYKKVFLYKMLGNHIIGTIETKDNAILTSQERLREVILKACKKCGLNVVGEKYHVFENPKGITYCLILSQSHLILHSWPEESKLLFDLFTCRDEKSGEECILELSASLNGKVLSIKKIKI